MNQLNHSVFWPALVILSLSVLCSLIFGAEFIGLTSSIQKAILTHFDWLFDSVTLLFLLLLVILYVSPYSLTIIGGSDAKPILTKPQWFMILLCTTVATGILFWGPAEPIYHLAHPPKDTIVAYSMDATQEALAVVFLHWSFSPYAIYCFLAMSFAIFYYNDKRKFSVSTVFGLADAPKRTIHSIIDIIAIFSLVAGMAAALGTGSMMMGLGCARLLGIDSGPWLWAIIILLVVVSFVISSILGLHKGIKKLSYVNFGLFIVLSLFILSNNSILELVKLAGNASLVYVKNFFNYSIATGEVNTEWRHEWTSFYWANWYAWAPISAIFLGKLGVGYSIRAFIRFNLLYPSIFGICWMSIFSGSSIIYAGEHGSKGFYDQMMTKGTESVIFTIINNLPFATIIMALFILAVFISYTTAADSNTAAMSGVSIDKMDHHDIESPAIMKILWGSIIGLLSWVMISYAGIDGVRILSVIGGFPIVILSLLIPFSLYKSLIQNRRDI